jgi:hypothetical protein
MQRRNPARVHSQWRVPEPWQAHIKLAAMVVVTAVTLIVLSLLLPHSLVLPAFCLVATVAAAATALFAWTSGAKHDAEHVTAWDVAGALAFIAVAAGLMSNPEHVVYLADNATLKVSE